MVRRLAFAQQVLQLHANDPNLMQRLYFVDECTVDLKWRPAPHTVVQYGIKKKGQNGGGRPENHFVQKTRAGKLNILAAAGCDGTVDLIHFDGKMTGATFLR